MPNILKVGPYNLKGRIFSVGGELGELIPELEKKGITATNAEITNALRGRYNCKKGRKVLAGCKEIVEQWEAEFAKEKEKADLQETSCENHKN